MKKSCTLFLIAVHLVLSTGIFAAEIRVPADHATIQAAIDAAESGDIVMVAQGTYLENLMISVKNNLTINGGYAADFSARDPSQYVTVIDGGQKATTIAIQASSSTTIDGFTITNGKSTSFGGGIVCYQSSPTISNNVITRNSVMSSSTEEMVLGGGIYASESIPTIINNVLSFNDAGGPGEGWGGAIFMNQSDGEIRENTIVDNNADNGGGISCLLASPKISANVIARNTAIYGGGIGCYYSNPNSIIRISNNIFAGNTASQNGASIYCFDSQPFILNCTFIRNFSKKLGNIYLFNQSNEDAPFVLNCLFWQNSDEIIFQTNVIPDIFYSRITDQRFANYEGNISSNPMFVDLEGGNYALSSESPCINAGYSDMEYYDPDGSRNDMGAFGGPGATDWGSTIPLVPVEMPAVDEDWGDLETYGGQIPSLAIDRVNNSKLFATSYKGDGLFVTTDKGSSWKSIPGFRNFECNQVNVDGSNPLRVWVAFNHYIARSDDGGDSWSKWALPETRLCQSVAVHPNDGRVVYVGAGGPGSSTSSGTIFKTEDGGSSWQKLNLEADKIVKFIAVNPSQPDEIWALTGHNDVGTLYRSDNGGVSWNPDTFASNYIFHKILIDPQHPSNLYLSGSFGIFRSTNSGQNWLQTDISDKCDALALDPSNPNIIYASSIEPIQPLFFVSLNAGVSWESYALSAIDSFDTLAVSPDTGQLYGGGYASGVYTSENGGQTWTAVNNGIRANEVYDSAVNQKDPAELLVGTIAGVFRKDAQGLWHRLTNQSSNAVAYDPIDGNTLYSGQDKTLAKSVNGGDTWEETVIVDTTKSYYISSIAIDPTNSQVLYLGILYADGDKGEVYKSNDGGQTFELIFDAPAPKNVPINTVLIDPSDHRIVYAGSGMFFAPPTETEPAGNVYQSTDGGTSWSGDLISDRDVVVNAIQVDPGNSQVIYAACGDSGAGFRGLYKSVDGGQSWEDKSFIADAVTDIQVDPQKPEKVYAATYTSGIFMSIDGGDNWTSIGLSDYYTNDISYYKISGSQIMQKSMSFKAAASESTVLVYAGTNSGVTGYTGSSIYGIIYNSDSMAVIYPADVWLDVGADNNIQALIWNNGHYLIIKPPVGDNYTLHCQAESLTDKISGISVWSKAELNFDFYLKSNNENPSPENGGSNGGGGGGGCFIDALRYW